MHLDNFEYHDELDVDQLELEFQRDFDEKDFPTRLKIALRYCGLSRKEIYEAKGITEATISNYTNGKQVPNRANIEKLADVTGVNISWLIGARHANIEYNRYRHLSDSKFSRGFEERLQKIALLLIRTLHVNPQQLDMYIKLIRSISELKAEGIQKLIDYAKDISLNPRYHNFRKSNYRYSIDSDFDRSSEEMWSQYDMLIRLNDLTRNLDLNTKEDERMDSFYGYNELKK